MRVFSDFHHDDLFHSFHLLFEKRLGWELYAPVGTDWYINNYWHYSTEPRVIHQYLVDGWKWEKHGDHCLMDNPCHERKLRALTFEQFKEKPIDIIISSVPEHELTYHRLRKDFKPKAKLIQHWGNEWEKFKPQFSRNWMVSCAPFKVPEGINAVFYHQEFDLDLFSFSRGKPANPIKSFVNDLPNLKDWRLFQRYEKKLSSWKWLSHGLGCRDGNVSPLKELVKQMKQASFIFHAKHLGDGFGHLIHNLFALGRPGLIRGKWYKGRAAEVLIQDQKTCIDLDQHSFEDNCQLIHDWSETAAYYQMSRNARKRFDEVVNYEKEFYNIKDFLRRLQ